MTIFMLVIGSFILSTLLIVSTSVAHGQTISTITIPMKVYYNSTYGVVIQYPASWNVSNISSNNSPSPFQGIVLMTPPIQSTGNEFASIVVGQYPQSVNTTLQSFLDHNKGIRMSNSNTKDFNIVMSNANSLLAGRQAYGLLFTDTFHGHSQKSLELGTFGLEHRGIKYGYIVNFSADPISFTKILPIMLQTINSFGISNIS
jgi:hypothetical protein